MKLRCTPNSIRLRLRKSDLQILLEQGEITAPINFGAGVRLHYALKIAPISTPQAWYENHQITISLPREAAIDWINSEQVSIEYHQSVEEGLSLHVLIEKDFPCRHTEEVDLKDTFFELAPKNDAPC